VVDSWCPATQLSRTQTDIAHWFYLLIRSTLWSFYLIFMPAAISISVIELSLCGQSHAANHWPLWLVVLSVLVLAPGHPCGSGWSALAPITPFNISGHVKNGFALDWRSDLRINTQRYTKSDGRRMKDKEQGTWHVLWKKGLRSQSSAPRPSKWYKNCQLEVSIHWQIAAIDVGGLKT